MASNRHLARTCVMQTIFAYEFRGGGDPKKILDEVLAEFAPKLKNADFAYSLLKNLIKNRKKILKVIETNAPEWPIEKIANVDRAILEIGICEILFTDNVPPVVAINEAIEISKYFGDRNSSKFINGVLSSVMDKTTVRKPAANKKKK